MSNVEARLEKDKEECMEKLAYMRKLFIKSRLHMVQNEIERIKKEIDALEVQKNKHSSSIWCWLPHKKRKIDMINREISILEYHKRKEHNNIKDIDEKLSYL